MPSNERSKERSKEYERSKERLRPTSTTCSNKSGGQKAAWKAEVDADDVRRQAGADMSS